MSKGRVPRPVRRMGTEVHADRRTRRRRTRADEKRAEIAADIADAVDADVDVTKVAAFIPISDELLEDGRDWEFDFYTQAWEDMIGGEDLD